MPKKFLYSEIARCPISQTRDAVVSACSNGTYTLAQQAKFEENGVEMSVFLKGAIHIDTVDNLKKLSVLLDDVVRMIEERKAMEEDEAWDLIESEEAQE